MVDKEEGIIELTVINVYCLMDTYCVSLSLHYNYSIL